MEGASTRRNLHQRQLSESVGQASSSGQFVGIPCALVNSKSVAVITVIFRSRAMEAKKFQMFSASAAMR